MDSETDIKLIAERSTFFVCLFGCVQRWNEKEKEKEKEKERERERTKTERANMSE